MEEEDQSTQVYYSINFFAWVLFLVKKFFFLDIKEKGEQVT
jgi:hypothetical protein